MEEPQECVMEAGREPPGRAGSRRASDVSFAEIPSRWASVVISLHICRRDGRQSSFHRFFVEMCVYVFRRGKNPPSLRIFSMEMSLRRHLARAFSIEMGMHRRLFLDSIRRDGRQPSEKGRGPSGGLAERAAPT